MCFYVLYNMCVRMMSILFLRIMQCCLSVCVSEPRPSPTSAPVPIREPINSSSGVGPFPLGGAPPVSAGTPPRGRRHRGVRDAGGAARPGEAPLGPLGDGSG